MNSTTMLAKSLSSSMNSTKTLATTPFPSMNSTTMLATSLFSPMNSTRALAFNPFSPMTSSLTRRLEDEDDNDKDSNDEEDNNLIELLCGYAGGVVGALLLAALIFSANKCLPKLPMGLGTYFEGPEPTDGEPIASDEEEGSEGAKRKSAKNAGKLHKRQIVMIAFGFVIAGPMGMTAGDNDWGYAFGMGMCTAASIFLLPMIKLLMGI